MHLCAHAHMKGGSTRKYEVVNGHGSTWEERELRPHKSLLLRSRQIFPIEWREYLVSFFCNGLLSLCYKRRGRGTIMRVTYFEWEKVYHLSQGFSIRFRVSSRVSSSFSLLIRLGFTFYLCFESGPRGCDCNRLAAFMPIIYITF